jgi:hypothetical protein
MDQDVFESNVPLRILVGWAEGVSKNDAADIAKGFIQRRFDAVDASWYVTAAFMGGFFWEVHEGGKGSSYMPAIIEALTNDPGGQHWFPSGDRIFQVMMRDGKPFGVLLQKSETNKIFDSGSLPLRASGKMKRAVFKGTSVLYAGGGLFGSSVLFFLATAALYFFVATPEPAIKDVNLSKLPASQWEKLTAIKPTEVVSRLEFEAGDWKVEKRPFEIRGLVRAESIKSPEAPKALPTIQTPDQAAPAPMIAPPPPVPAPMSPGEKSSAPGVGVPDQQPPIVGDAKADAPSSVTDAVSDPVVPAASAAGELPSLPKTVPLPTANPAKATKASHPTVKPKAASPTEKPVSSSGKPINEQQRSKSAGMIDRAASPAGDKQAKSVPAAKSVGKPTVLLPGDVK